MKLTAYQKDVIVDGIISKQEEASHWLSYYRKRIEHTTAVDAEVIKGRIEVLENKLSQLEDLKKQLDL